VPQGSVRARLIQDPGQSPDGKRLVMSVLTNLYVMDLPDGQWIAHEERRALRRRYARPDLAGAEDAAEDLVVECGSAAAGDFDQRRPLVDWRLPIVDRRIVDY
jgi:hypothetical protein